ncbi:MAG TPA: pilus assembly protein TadG-related protein, partial [Novosphingobium sp.]|nr:pilus assembly protein TadG-related protein [Novosphingobium sp.]
MTLLPPVFTAILSGLLRLAGRQMRRLRRDTGGNMMIIMGLSAVPLIFAVGFGIDYSRAQKMQTKLTAIADSAALLAVSPVYLGKTDDVAAAAAQAQFDAQTTSLKGVTITSRSVTAVTTSSGSLGGRRVATATYHATSTNMFGK